MKFVVGFVFGVCVLALAQALPASTEDSKNAQPVIPSIILAAMQPIPELPTELNELARIKREQERVVFNDDSYQPCRTGNCNGGAVPVRETCSDGKCGNVVTTVRESSCPDGRCGVVRESSIPVSAARETSSCPDGRCGTVRESSCPSGRCTTVRESSCPSGRCGSSYVTTIRETYQQPSVTYQQPSVTYQQPITTYSCRGSGCGGGSIPVRESGCPSGRCGSYVSYRETYSQPITTYSQPITTYSCRGSGCGGGGSYPVRESGCPSGRCGSYVRYQETYSQPITTYSCRGSGCGK